ncbi:hypothetical protein EV421DRAFT_2021915 [Armillaria borealis]|uniref:Uncharacterized protein n=1 Tax=Armillaria borealis TaxID=47425 RepID=A0AA39J5S6_9AGAR|nr:hypothetical protein EV421DRAFT_2021915 [Armillaria borealis]
MSTASPHPDRKPCHASTMDIDQAESGPSRLLLEKSLSDDPQSMVVSSIALQDASPGQSMEYFVVKELPSAYGKLLDVYKHVRHDMLGLIPWYTHLKLLRILFTLSTALAKRLSPTFFKKFTIAARIVHFTVDIRKQCKVLGPKIEAEIFISQTLMEKRYRLFNPEKVYRIVEPLNMYSMALYFASGILVPLALLFDTS